MKSKRSRKASQSEPAKPAVYAISKYDWRNAMENVVGTDTLFEELLWSSKRLVESEKWEEEALATSIYRGISHGLNSTRIAKLYDSGMKGNVRPIQMSDLRCTRRGAFFYQDRSEEFRDLFIIP